MNDWTVWLTWIIFAVTYAGLAGTIDTISAMKMNDQRRGGGRTRRTPETILSEIAIRHTDAKPPGTRFWPTSSDTSKTHGSPRRPGLCRQRRWA